MMAAAAAAGWMNHLFSAPGGETRLLCLVQSSHFATNAADTHTHKTHLCESHSGNPNTMAMKKKKVQFFLLLLSLRDRLKLPKSWSVELSTCSFFTFYLKKIVNGTRHSQSIETINIYIEEDETLNKKDFRHGICCHPRWLDMKDIDFFIFYSLYISLTLVCVCVSLLFRRSWPDMITKELAGTLDLKPVGLKRKKSKFNLKLISPREKLKSVSSFSCLLASGFLFFPLPFDCLAPCLTLSLPIPIRLHFVPASVWWWCVCVQTL
jgi:hypothetical protein